MIGINFKMALLRPKTNASIQPAKLGYEYKTTVHDTHSYSYSISYITS